jgi:hypothetical protein
LREKKRSWPLRDLYRRALQLGLELCPAEGAPQLRLEYLNQPVGEFLHVAMRPIATYGGDLVDLTEMLSNVGNLTQILPPRQKKKGLSKPDAHFVDVSPLGYTSKPDQRRVVYDQGQLRCLWHPQHKNADAVAGCGY